MKFLSHHHWAQSRGFSNVNMMSFKQLFLLLTIVVVVSGHVTGAEQSRTERHVPKNTKFVKCEAGQEFATKVLKENAITDIDGKVHSFTSKKGKQKFYVCHTCSMCGDGIQQIAHCHENEDTKCGGCIDSSYMFDEATKSCQPEHVIKGIAEDVAEDNVQADSADTQESQPEEKTTDRGNDAPAQIVNGDDSSDQFDNAKNGQLPLKGDFGSKHESETDDTRKPTLTAVVAVFSVVILVLIVTIVVYVAIAKWRSRTTDDTASVAV